MRIPLTVLLSLLVVACATTQHGSSTGLVMQGSSATLQPRALSASTQPRGEMMVSVDLPHSGYVTVLRVFPDGGVSVLSSNTGDELTRTELSAGTHRLALFSAPVLLNAAAAHASDLALRSRSAQDDVAQRHTDHYALLIVTEKPVSWTMVQASLADVDFKGMTSEVMGRMARAIGDGSSGSWSAVATKASGL